eukprot:SAG31_NODE_4550_length_3145_cov_2.221274_1_plen_84_part_00
MRACVRACGTSRPPTHKQTTNVGKTTKQPRKNDKTAEGPPCSQNTVLVKNLLSLPFDQQCNASANLAKNKKKSCNARNAKLSL